MVEVFDGLDSGGAEPAGLHEGSEHLCAALDVLFALGVCLGAGGEFGGARIELLEEFADFRLLRSTRQALDDSCDVEGEAGALGAGSFDGVVGTTWQTKDNTGTLSSELDADRKSVV